MKAYQGLPKTYKSLKELKMPPKTSEITELPKNFFVLIKNIKQFDYAIDTLKPANANSWFIRVYGEETEERFWYNKSVQLRYKNNKLQVGCTDKDYNLPTLSFKRFKELTNSSRNS